MQYEELSAEYMDRQRKGRLMLLTMLIFFAAPVVAVLAMYKLDWRPQGSSAGELVVPAKLLKVSALLHQHDGSVTNAVFKDKWSMVYVSGKCAEACKEKLHIMRQLHASLYKEIPRMQRVWLTTTVDVTTQKNDYPDMLILNQPTEAVVSLAEQFKIADEQVLSADRLYLVDPLGHLMMSYRADTPAKNIRKDITHLMKYSWAG